MTDTAQAPAGGQTSRVGDAQILDRVVVRFAGDSGDGMQLTGDRFTSVSAAYGNDLSTLPEFPAEIRAPAGTVHGVSSFQVHISDHQITTPGDEPNVLVAMNPAALRADLGRLEIGGTLIVNEDAFEERNLLKAGYHGPRRHGHQPARRRQPRQLPGDQGADDQPHQGGHGAPRCQAARRRAVEELLRPRPRVVDVHPAHRTDARVDRAAVRVQRAGRRRQPGGVPRRLQLRRDHRGRRPPLRGPPGPPARGRVHERHRQHGAGVGHRRRRSARQAPGHARLVPDHAGLGHPPRAVQAQALRRAHRAGRRRDRRRRHGPRRGVRRAPRRHDDERSGHGAEVRDDQPGRVAGAAAAHRRHPARRPVHRPAHQDRGRRPQHGRVRPPERGTAAGHRRVEPGRTASRRRSRRSASPSSTARR